MSRVSIPNNLRKTIQNLKEIAKNHSDEEIYAMLKECSMDPNETAQKLLLQDPFHEVKRKRDKRKENNREPADTRWRPAPQGRGVRVGGRGNYSSRHGSHDAGGEKNAGKENGIHQVTDKGSTSSIPSASHDTESKSTLTVSSSVACLPNDPAKNENPVQACGSTSKNSTFSGPASASESGLYASASDPVLMPSLDGHIPSSVGIIKREVGSQRTAVEATVCKVNARDVSNSFEMNHSHVHGKIGKSQGSDGIQLPDASQATLPLSRTSSGSRPSSNYSNRSQQLNGPQKAVGPTKEWKPKTTNVKPAPVSGEIASSNVEPSTHEASARSLPASSSTTLGETASTLQKKLEDLQFSDTKHVIIPNHLQVPKSERSGLSFGSFDANFGLATNFVNDTESNKGSAEQSEFSQEIEETDEKSSSSIQNVQEADYADRPQSPTKVLKNLNSSSDILQSTTDLPENYASRDPDISSNAPSVPEYDQEKPEAATSLDSSQQTVQTAPIYSNFELAPQIIGNQFAAFEGAESQSRDATRIPNFLVQQPFDPATNYYSSMYRPTSADGDGRFSPIFAPTSTTKYSGNVGVLPTPTVQTPQESANSLVLPSTGQAPLVTQAAGVMQSSIALSQPTLPVYRQPAGIHISPYPPNYFPYGQYFSPFYIPSPSMHPFLSNPAFPQQPPPGNIYPAPGTAGAAPLKFPLAQYKPTSNVGTPSHMGLPTNYGTYGPSAVTTGSSTGSEDLSSSQYKDNNVYMAGQQTEVSWIPTPGRDISAMQATPFYNLPPQGQHMTFPGIYHHPGQTVAPGTVHPMLQPTQGMSGPVEMVAPPSGVYQQPQRTWVNNYLN